MVSALNYQQKWQKSGFGLYVGQRIWLQMVSNYSSHNEIPSQNICDKIIMLHYHSNKTLIQLMSMEVNRYLHVTVLLCYHDNKPFDVVKTIPFLRVYKTNNIRPFSFKSTVELDI